MEQLKQCQYINRREELKALSAGFKMLIKCGAIGSINEGLANYYREQGHAELKSYRRWQDEGFQVKKGSKALLLWGEPVRRKDKEPTEPAEDDFSFFPVAYVFSNLQVEKTG
jgi:hypothetical protein